MENINLKLVRIKIHSGKTPKWIYTTDLSIFADVTTRTI